VLSGSPAFSSSSPSVLAWGRFYKSVSTVSYGQNFTWVKYVGIPMYISFHAFFGTKKSRMRKMSKIFRQNDHSSNRYMGPIL
jgi:hypothetical protein